MTEVWSCGGGTQSGAIAVLIGSGKLPKPDICFMTDTGREKSGTWPFVDGFIRPQLARVVRRVRKQHRAWLDLWYPLIFAVPMRRHECVSLIRATGWDGPIPHSACKMCPNMRDDEWIDMQRNYPQDFADAAQIERDIREKDPHFYLHPACIPLDQVDFTAQHTMFADRGCTTGCFT